MIWRGQQHESAATQPSGTAAGPQPSVGTRVDSILEAAERAAAEIRADAEEGARRYYEESRRRTDEMAAQRARDMAALTDSLIERARTVARQSDQLISGLEEAERRMSGAAGSPPPSVRADGDQAPAAPPASAPPPSVAPAATGAPPVPEGARLLATQMTIAGSSRDEIARRLRDEFGILDPTTILNELGA